jgi:hypothetical protein
MRFQYASGSTPLEGFVIKRGIGRGGFGEVYFATSGGGKEVALKHIERNLEVELRGVGQCLNLKHPNLIDLYDIRYDDLGDAWVVMEYVAGASLKDTIDRNPNGLPLAQVEFWFRGIAAGVAYLHDHGIVHRDLKPGNIFEDNGFVKIGDYGLSKFISTSRRSAQTESVGTFHYMAPEIGKGVYGKEIDIYALGILLFEMITGRTPFDGESSQEIIMKHLTDDPDLSGVPQPYRAVIQRALQKDPQKRFHNAAEMVAALRPEIPGPGSAAKGDYEEPLLYIGDEMEGIEFGPLVEHSEKAVAQPVVQPPVTTPIAHVSPASANTSGQIGALSTPIKVALLVGAAVVAGFQGAWLLSCAALLACVYVVYLGFRMVTLPVSIGRSAFQGAATGQLETRVSAIPISRAVLEQTGRQMLREKTTADQVGELTGSMLSAAAIAVVLAIGMSALGDELVWSSASEAAGPFWLWLMTTLGSWLVLVAGKWSERGTRHVVQRRLVMLALGLVFGLVAYATSQHLMVSFGEGSIDRGIRVTRLAEGMYEANGMPKLQAFMCYFAAVFATLGWWKQCDPLRSWRIKITPILVAILAAWVWHLMWPFPQPWGFMLVGAISIATQLSAPRLSRAQCLAVAARSAE